nr:proline-rich receptor-like protein kinase PERK2 [Paramormyrops kingsleyae]XP_023692513.1 proline-rich receptor-like protein kinase PERK2 [Paramormyrops kingsleyae]
MDALRTTALILLIVTMASSKPIRWRGNNLRKMVTKVVETSESNESVSSEELELELDPTTAPPVIPDTTLLAVVTDTPLPLIPEATLEPTPPPLGIETGAPLYLTEGPLISDQPTDPFSAVTPDTVEPLAPSTPQPISGLPLCVNVDISYPPLPSRGDNLK